MGGNILYRGGGWKLTFRDEFNGSSGAPPDSSKWDNPELSSDFPGPVQNAKFLGTNAYQDGNGNLVIRSARESSGGASYTSGQISTRSNFSQVGGRWEYRAIMPAGGSGIWPALWQLASNWPTGGEIDTLEMFADMTNAQGYFHYNNGGHQFTGGTYATGVSGYNVYATEWDPGSEIRWYFNGALVQTFTSSFVTSDPMWIMLDTYIGGAAGDPTATTFPQFFLIDYVRVYQRG